MSDGAITTFLDLKTLVFFFDNVVFPNFSPRGYPYSGWEQCDNHKPQNGPPVHKEIIIWDQNECLRRSRYHYLSGTCNPCASP
jgi:hypothetical protein